MTGALPRPSPPCTPVSDMQNVLSAAGRKPQRPGPAREGRHTTTQRTATVTPAECRPAQSPPPSVDRHYSQFKPRTPPQNQPTIMSHTSHKHSSANRAHVQCTWPALRRPSRAVVRVISANATRRAAQEGSRRASVCCTAPSANSSAYVGPAAPEGCSARCSYHVRGTGMSGGCSCTCGGAHRRAVAQSWLAITPSAFLGDARPPCDSHGATHHHRTWPPSTLHWLLLLQVGLPCPC